MAKITSSLIAVMILAWVAHGITIHVPSEYSTIQAGINASTDGDTVLVADGTYTGTGNKNIDFLGKAIVVTSENGADSCIIDCQNDGRGFNFHSWENSSSVLSGFTVTHGQVDEGGGIYCNSSSPDICDCIIEDNMAVGPGYGGGIFCEYSSNPLIYNCSIEGNDAAYGGGICLWYGSPCPTIDRCTISGNTASRGGGIYSLTNNTNLSISNCTIIGNRAEQGGGIYYSQEGGSLSNCKISNNIAESMGGGIFCDWVVNTFISHCTISENTSLAYGWGGGGIYCEKAGPTLEYCSINGNSANSDGGGMLSFWSCPTLNYCTISGNSAGDEGGGIRCDGMTSLYHCTISRNSANNQGGGIVYKDPLVTPNLIMDNSIVEGNTGNGGIYFYTPEGVEIFYGDFYNNEGGNFTGTVPAGLGEIFTINANGDSCDVFYNIFEDPLFEDPAGGNFQITWANFPIPDSTKSPCIDAGDPGSPPDPDGTIADVGALYFDQSLAVSVTLTPYNPPIVIPASGGEFDYYIEVENHTTAAETFDLWADIYLPGIGTVPVMNLSRVTLPGSVILGRDYTQQVPYFAPAGTYTYYAYLGRYPWVIEAYDSFTFEKDGGGSAIAGLGLPADWICRNKNCEAEFVKPASEMPEEYALLSAFPNPFNATTTISFELRDASWMKLEVCDITGRSIAELVNGWREAGSHEVAFDGSELPSGIYLYRLQAGDYTASGKMVLMK